MNTPDPIKKSLVPSGSTLASGLGGALAVIVISALGGLDVKVSPELASAITVVCATVAGYLPSSGRSN